MFTPFLYVYYVLRWMWFLVADQTPTPTTFLKDCENMGLFQDLPLTVPATKNPFDESFRKAVIDPDVSNNVLASILYVFGDSRHVCWKEIQAYSVTTVILYYNFRKIVSEFAVPVFQFNTTWEWYMYYQIYHGLIPVINKIWFIILPNLK